MSSKAPNSAVIVITKAGIIHYTYRMCIHMYDMLYVSYVNASLWLVCGGGSGKLFSFEIYNK